MSLCSSGGFLDLLAVLAAGYGVRGCLVIQGGSQDTKCFLCTYAEILKVGHIKLHHKLSVQFFKGFEQPC